MPFLPPGLITGTERNLNRLLARDPAAPARLSALAGKRLALCLTKPSMAVVIDFHEKGVALSRPPDEKQTGSVSGDADVAFESVSSKRPDTRVELDAETLGALIGGTSVQSLLTDNRLIVEGDLGLLTKARTLASDLDLDPEGALSRLAGEIPAHGLAAGLRRLGRTSLNLSTHLRQDLRNYMVEEGEWLAGRDRFEMAREHLTELSIEADRLEARTKRLERRFGGSPS